MPFWHEQVINPAKSSSRLRRKEGSCAAWLHDLLKQHAAQVLVAVPLLPLHAMNGCVADTTLASLRSRLFRGDEVELG